MSNAFKLTAGQKKFLKAVAANQHASFHVRVTRPLFDAGLVFPRVGAIFPWLVGCNGQYAPDYAITEAGIAALEAA